MTGFDGIAVGVGTGKILGNIRIVSLTIGRYDFPCSITVMFIMERLCNKNINRLN